MALLYYASNDYAYIQITSQVQDTEQRTITIRGNAYKRDLLDQIYGDSAYYVGPVFITGDLTTNGGTQSISWSGYSRNSGISVCDINTTIAYPDNSVNQSLTGTLDLKIADPDTHLVRTIGHMSVNWTFPKLPLNIPTPTLSASSVNFNSSVNIVTSDPDSASLKYDITYAFGSATGSIGTNLSAGTKAWTVPNSLMSQIPSATSGVIKINVTAKSESGEELTSWQLDLTANVPTSVVPTISALTVAEAATIPSALSGLYIQSKSKFSVTGTAAGAQGSTISKYSTTVDGTTYSGATFTSNFIKSSGTVAVKMTVTDSRGRTASKTTNVTVQAYTAPALTAVSAYRCTSASSSTAKPDGGYICVKPTGSVTSLSSNNTKTCKIYYKKSSVSSYTASNLSVDYTLDTEFGIFTADINSSYDVYVTLQDAFSTTTFYCPQVSSGGAYIHIPPDRSGMGLGKRREASGNIETAWNIKSNGDITADADGRPISLMTSGIKLMNFYSSRPSTLNLNSDGSGGMIHFLSTSTANDSGTKPTTPAGTKRDGHVIHLFWDTTAGWASQLFITNGLAPEVYVRAQNGSNAFGTWRQLLDTTNFEELVMKSSSADLTMSLPSGVTGTYTTKSVVKTGKICELIFSANLVGNVTVAEGTVIFTVPEGYRPVVPVDVTMFKYNLQSTSGPTQLRIATDGKVAAPLANDTFNPGAGGSFFFIHEFYICA